MSPSPLPVRLVSVLFVKDFHSEKKKREGREKSAVLTCIWAMHRFFLNGHLCFPHADCFVVGLFFVCVQSPYLIISIKGGNGVMSPTFIFVQ